MRIFWIIGGILTLLLMLVFTLSSPLKWLGSEKTDLYSDTTLTCLTLNDLHHIMALGASQSDSIGLLLNQISKAWQQDKMDDSGACWNNTITMDLIRVSNRGVLLHKTPNFAVTKGLGKELYLRRYHPLNKNEKVTWERALALDATPHSPFQMERSQFLLSRLDIPLVYLNTQHIIYINQQKFMNTKLCNIVIAPLDVYLQE
jgi:hypothetical protein